jgi:hypothetical protein
MTPSSSPNTMSGQALENGARAEAGRRQDGLVAELSDGARVGHRARGDEQHHDGRHDHVRDLEVRRLEDLPRPAPPERLAQLFARPWKPGMKSNQVPCGPIVCATPCGGP